MIHFMHIQTGLQCDMSYCMHKVLTDDDDMQAAKDKCWNINNPNTQTKEKVCLHGMPAPEVAYLGGPQI